MRVEFSDKKYLFDGSDDFVNVNPIQSIYGTLRTNGYSILDMSYGRNSYIPMNILTEDFEIVENSGRINYTVDKIYKPEYDYWYNSKLDFFISAGKEELDGYSLEEDDVEPSSIGYYKINTIFHKENINEVSEYLNKNTVPNLSTKSKIDIIIQTQTGFRFKEHSINVQDVDIDLMYNDNFKPVHEHMVDKLNNGGKGIVLLHGVAGSGKTSYIKYLTTLVDHKFVFLPIGMIGHLSSPSFIGDLISKKGCVLVIEDCENYIQDRRTSQESVVSPLLQLTDGILSDITDIKVICTFNNDLTKVDEALLREGRLIAEYKFDKLTTDKVEALTGHHSNEEKTLAEIFNELTYTDNKQEDKKIGFGR